jgi:hypothetical protein
MIVFLHVPKTAGSTFQFVLENSLGIYHCHTFHNRKPFFDQGDYAFARKVFPWMRSLGGGNIIDPLALRVPDPFYMTLLREPVARVFSHYQHMARRGTKPPPFEESLRSKGVLENLHVKLMSGGRNLDRAKMFLEKCGFVGLTEKFDLSLEILGKLSPCNLNLGYRRKQIAPDNTIKKSLESDSRIVDMTRESNRLDLELYSFAVQEIFPRLCEKAGVNPLEPIPSRERYGEQVPFRCSAGRLYNRFFRQITKIRIRSRNGAAEESSEAFYRSLEW